MDKKKLINQREIDQGSETRRTEGIIFL